MMTEREIVSLLSGKIDRALNEGGSSELSEVRQENYNRYVGKPYGNERDGYSSVVTRESLEAVEWALPSIMRVFTASDRIVEFEPVGPEDVQEAEQQTDIANHYLVKEGNAFLALYDWFKDALMYPNGYVKLVCIERVKTTVEEYEHLTAFGLQQTMASLQERGEVEVLEQEVEAPDVQQAPGPIPGQFSGPIPGQVPGQIPPGPIPGQIPGQAPGQPPMGGGYEESYTIKVRITEYVKQPELLPVPPDEMLVDNNCTSINLDEAAFVAQRLLKTRTELIEEGYDADMLDQVGSMGDYLADAERSNLLYSEAQDWSSEDDDPAMQRYWLHDCYLLIDEDGDEVAEHRRIVMIGDQIFSDEETDYQPFVALATIMLPHQHPGLSLIDLTKDLQEIRSTLFRQLLDNVYKQNVRRKYVGDAFISDEAGTLDVLLDNASEFIPSRDPNAIREEQVQPIVTEILPVIAQLSDMQGVRTGITPQLSLDPEVLQGSTMGAYTAALDQASQRIEMIVRIFAETGMRHLMRKMHHILRTYIDQAKTIRIRGDWVEFNSAHWQERTNVSVHVGLGHNNKAQEVAALMQTLQLQQQSLPLGVTNPEQIMTTLGRLIESMGVGAPEQFFSPPPPPAPPAPDPMLQVAQQDLQIRAQEAQTKAQAAQTKAQTDAMEVQAKLQQSQQELQLKLQEMQKKIESMDAEKKLTDAKTLKTLEEARELDMDNDATESGVVDLLNART